MTRAEFVAETAMRATVAWKCVVGDVSFRNMVVIAQQLADALEQTPDCPWVVNLREAKAMVERTCSNPSMHPLACGCIR